MKRRDTLVGMLFVVAAGGWLGCGAESDGSSGPAAATEPPVEGATTGEQPAPPEVPDPEVGEPAKLSYYKDVAPILDMNCTRCHGPGGVRAQVPFTSYEAVAPFAALIRQKVVERTMPPWLAGDGCAEYAYDESLTEAEIATLSEWADTGAQMGAPDVVPADVLPRQFAKLTREDLTIEMPVDYVMTTSPDDYRCFLIDWPVDHETYITGFGARPGNTAVVHHIIAYHVPPSSVETFEAFDAADDGPGYQCFGGPSGAGGNAQVGTRFLGGWAPGGLGSDFPPNTGIPMEPGSKIALQMHYNTLTAEPQPDRTSVVFKIDDEVEHEAFIMPWTSFGWVLGQGMEIPAGEADVSHRWAEDPWKLPFYNVSSGKLRLYTVNLHMHTLGTSGSVFIERQDGTEECLLNMPFYDFGWQRSYGFAKPRDLFPGDKLGLECHWDNTQENQAWKGSEQLEPVDQKWGEGTTDEMCIAFFYVIGLDADAE